MKLKKLTTKISAKKLKEARYKARYFGAEAVANDEGVSEYYEDLAIAYGYDDWADMPSDLRGDAHKHYIEGRQIERRGGSLL